MRTSTLRSAILFVLVTAVTTRARQPAVAWPPPVQKVSAASPVRSPEDELKTFFLPPGYRLELVAAEPLVEDPVAIDLDADGRLWVVEMLGYMPDAAARGERDPVGRVVVLEDTDDDGRMDRRTVFLDGLVLPRSIKVLEHGVLVAEPPNLWLARDTNGDLRADTKDLVRKDYGRAQGNPEHNANSLMWGLDNWIHTSEHAGYLRWRLGQFEHRPTLPRGQWGVTMDDVGRVYRNWNENPLYVDLISPHYFVRNPNLVSTRGAYESISEDTSVWPVRPTPGVNRGYREGTLRPDGTLAVFNSAGTPVVYRGDRLPAELRGNVFVTEPAGNLVRRMVVTDGPDGRLSAKNAYARAEFLTSTDERFRPVNLLSAADGTLYVVDMYRGIIQHLAYQSEYLKNHIRTNRLQEGIHLGRIFRVVHESTKRDARPALSAQPAAALVTLLSHPNGWRRDTAQRLLVERADRSVVPALTAIARAPASNDVPARLHALWTLEGLDAIDVALVDEALNDPSPHVRASAVRLSERWLREAGHPLHARVVAALDDASPVVRRQAAASVGELPEGPRELAMGAVLEKRGDDPVAVDAALSGARGREAMLLERLLRASTPSSSHADVVATLAGAIVRSRQSAAVQSMLGWAGETARPAWQRLAILKGAESGLPGAGSLAALMAAAVIGEGAAAAGSPRLTLEAAPRALEAMKVEKGEIGARAARLFEAFDWPGKPKPEGRAARALSPAEQKRFAAGQEVYRNLCVACHQAEGTGLAGLAPPLVGSKWVLGRAGLFARIVLNGKESTTLMPPLGATLTDQQIADVLTYVRRSWGHQATPVDVGLVREVRGASTGRDRPWTEPELATVTQPDGIPRGRGQGQ
jgi:mono/diheme cytochrome c family protein/glucose/arabinose dehydrogenase